MFPRRHTHPREVEPTARTKRNANKQNKTKQNSHNTLRNCQTENSNPRSQRKKDRNPSPPLPCTAFDITLTKLSTKHKEKTQRVLFFLNTPTKMSTAVRDKDFKGKNTEYLKNGNGKKVKECSKAKQQQQQKKKRKKTNTHTTTKSGNDMPSLTPNARTSSTLASPHPPPPPTPSTLVFSLRDLCACVFLLFSWRRSQRNPRVPAAKENKAQERTVTTPSHTHPSIPPMFRRYLYNIHFLLCHAFHRHVYEEHLCAHEACTWPQFLGHLRRFSVSQKNYPPFTHPFKARH